MTAAEMLDELSRDPEYVAEQAQRDLEHQRSVERLRSASRATLADLKAEGVNVNDLQELIDRPDPRAAPVLLRRLLSEPDAEVRSLIARTLANETGRIAWPAIKGAYREEKDPWVRESIAAALAAAAQPANTPELTALVRDVANGPSRVLLLEPLIRSRDPLVRGVLEELATDPDLAAELAARMPRGQQALAPSSDVTDQSGLAETSISLDLDGLPELAYRIERAVGISPDDANAIVEAGNNTPVEHEARVAIRTKHGDLEIRVFVDDRDAIDLYVRGPAALVELLEGAFKELVSAQ